MDYSTWLMQTYEERISDLRDQLQAEQKALVVSLPAVARVRRAPRSPGAM